MSRLDSRSDVKVRKFLDNGVVAEFRRSWYFVPISATEHRDRETIKKAVYKFAVEDDPDIIASGIDVEDMVEIGSETRAILWGRLQNQVGESYETNPLEWPDVDARYSSDTRERDIPLRVAKESKETIAAYLFATGATRTAISNALDVSESTVGQYISNFKSGGR